MIHFSCSEIKTLVHKDQSIYRFKPTGLWYSTGREWINFYINHIDKISSDCKYMYKLKLRYTSFEHPDKNKVLKITNEKSFDKFTLKYGGIDRFEESLNMYFINIDWQTVSNDYGGVEIIPLIPSRMIVASWMPLGYDKKIIQKYNNTFKFIKKTDKSPGIHFWQNELDVPSGCVWEPNAIRSFKRTYKI